jgi:hypothetical protein
MKDPQKGILIEMEPSDSRIEPPNLNLVDDGLAGSFFPIDLM